MESKTKRCIDMAILPINRARITAGYKNPSYQKKMGFGHYGTDITDVKRSDRNIYAPVPVKIVAAGTDSLMGGTVVAVSVNEVDVHYGPKKGSQRLVFLFAHLDKVYVKKGDVVKPEDKALGLYGGTGVFGGGAAGRHLHVEVSTNVANPCSSPTLKRSATIWKAGPDRTINPMDVFKVDADGVLGFKQTLSFRSASKDWVLKDDKQTLDLTGRLIDAKPVS